MSDIRDRMHRMGEDSMKQNDRLVEFETKLIILMEAANGADEVEIPLPKSSAQEIWASSNKNIDGPTHMIPPKPMER